MNAAVDHGQRHAADQHRQQEDDQSDRSREYRDDAGAERQQAKAEKGELERHAKLRLEPFGFIGHQQRGQHEHECERHEKRGALEEEKRVKVEQRAEQEVDKRGAILEVPALRGGHGSGVADGFALGKEHLHQDHGDEQQVSGLLDDCRPGVDAVEHRDVEYETAHERRNVESLFVLFVAKLEPL